MFRATHTGFAKAALCVALFVCGTPLAANPVTNGVAQLEYGYMCKVATEEEMVAEDTISGTVSLVTDPPPFTYRGTTVPAEIGVEFGVRVMVLPPLVLLLFRLFLLRLSKPCCLGWLGTPQRLGLCQLPYQLGRY